MISVHNYSYTYQNGIQALTGINCTINSGEFVLLSGSNGGGKSTLLKSLLGITRQYFGGNSVGNITFDGKPVEEYGIVKLAGSIGIVLQDPESQISNMSVWEEVTFALGNLLFLKNEIISRGSNALAMVELSGLKENSVHSLSGGQLQRLSIATLLALQPKVLIFDEPLANLDPLGVISVIEALKTLKNFVEVVIVASHWLDPFLELATRLIIIDGGKLVLDIDPCFIESHLSTLETYNVELPQRIRIEHVLRLQGVITKNVNGSICLPDSITIRPVQIVDMPKIRTAVSLERVIYSYNKNVKSLKDITTSLEWGSQVALVGHNGAGKTTLARLLSGLRKPSSGSIINFSSSVAMMPQRPSLGFLATTVLGEVMYGTTLGEKESILLLSRFDLLQYRNQSPFELSGGEQRRLSLALMMAKDYDFLILDEPTAGLDALQVRFLQQTLENYRGTAVYITHDPRLVGNFLREVIVLDNGCIKFHGSTTRLHRHLLEHLGYPGINPTVALGLRYLDKQVPMSPEQLEVNSAISI